MQKFVTYIVSDNFAELIKTGWSWLVDTSGTH